MTIHKGSNRICRIQGNPLEGWPKYGITRLVTKRRAFTLIEIMLVVGILAILMAIAVPNFYAAAEQGRQKSCIANMTKLEWAKEQYAMANNIPTGGPVAMANLVPTYIQGATPPVCPSGGTYNLNTIGTATTCTIGGTYPHILTGY